MIKLEISSIDLYANHVEVPVWEVDQQLFFGVLFIPPTLLYNELQVHLTHFCALPSSSMHIHIAKWIKPFAIWK